MGRCSSHPRNPAGYELHEGEEQPGGCAFDHVFEILGEASVAVQPCECPLHDPAEQHRGLQALWLQYDHVVVHSRGGETSMTNLVVTCPACNFGRDRFMLEEVRLRDPRSHIRRPTWEGWRNWDGLERVLPQREQFVSTQSEQGDRSWATDAPITLAVLQTSDGEESRSADLLHATRIADLHDSSGAASEVERIVLAFKDEPPTLAEDKLIQTLLDHPGSTCAEMSARHGWQENAWDTQYGRMCAKRLGVLQPVERAERMKLEPKIALLTTIVREDDGMLRYTTKYEAIEAFRQMGFRVEALHPNIQNRNVSTSHE